MGAELVLGTIAIFRLQLTFLSERNIYPIDNISLQHSNDKHISIFWSQKHILDVKYYLIQLRDLGKDTDYYWRTLAYITKRYSAEKDMSFQFLGFDNLTMYELNLALINDDQVIFSLSVIHDTWSGESLKGFFYTPSFNTILTYLEPVYMILPSRDGMFI